MVKSPYFYSKGIKILITFVLMSVHIKVSRTNTNTAEVEGLTFQPVKMGRWSKKTSKKQGQASHSKDSKARKQRRAFE